MLATRRARRPSVPTSQSALILWSPAADPLGPWYAISGPRGDHPGALPPARVIRRSCLPSRSMAKISQRPARSDAKAMRYPFGDQVGYSSAETCLVTRRMCEPSAFMT